MDLLDLAAGQFVENRGDLVDCRVVVLLDLPPRRRDVEIGTLFLGRVRGDDLAALHKEVGVLDERGP